MILARNFFSTFLLLLGMVAYSQGNNEKAASAKSYAKKQLMSVLSGKKQHNVVDNKTLLIKDSITAISVAEPLLFSIYGKENILQQRPYEVYFIDEYWIIWGTIPERW